MDNTGPGFSGEQCGRSLRMDKSIITEQMITEEETIIRIQSGRFSSTGVAYHFLQPDMTRMELSDGSTVARLGSELMGDPLAPDGGVNRFAAALSEETSGASVFHIEQKTAAALGRQGYKVCPMGVESRVGLPFSLVGKGKADLRRALNRSVKAGVIVRELSADEFESFEIEIAKLNERWLENRRCFRREFRFLARPYVGRFQPGERRFVAFEGERPVGLGVYDPVYDGGVVVGYFEAIVRCFARELAGVRDHLTLTAMDIFAGGDTPAKWISLGLSPFAPATRKNNEFDSSPVTQLALSLFFNHGNRVFNCRGLAFHKERYRGESKPVYFATKRGFPLTALYGACRLSYIDPLRFVSDSLVAGLRRFGANVKHALLSLFPSAGFSSGGEVDFLPSDGKR